MQPDARALINLTKEETTLNLLPTAYGNYCSSRRQKRVSHFKTNILL
jgi:hypothetical protein